MRGCRGKRLRGCRRKRLQKEEAERLQREEAERLQREEDERLRGCRRKRLQKEEAERLHLQKLKERKKLPKKRLPLQSTPKGTCYIKHVTIPNNLITCVYNLLLTSGTKKNRSSGSVAGFSKDLCFGDKIQDI